VNPPLTVAKGHGTENDFIVLPDLDGDAGLTADLVRALCNRRTGLGADGVLAVVRTASATEERVRAQAEVAEFFMDYRNADGSVAEMCGNGVRVFARYLQQAGLLDSDEFVVATRGGPRAVQVGPTEIRVAMGTATWRPERPMVRIAGADRGWPGIALDLPNPHVVVELSSEHELDGLDLSTPPLVEPPLPNGQNVEFVVVKASSMRMRVHERGVGETRSCGTGICAAVAVVASSVAVSGEPAGPAAVRSWSVEVPGGQCRVELGADEQIVLIGPAVLVGRVQLDPDWVATHR
jgi:diaminopimelate epimerase